MDVPESVRWAVDARAVELLDQTRLPEEERWIAIRDAAGMAAAIREMRVRGAPAIGVAAAMALALELAQATSLAPEAFRRRLADAAATLRSARPTAANLAWAVGRLVAVAEEHRDAAPGVVACKVWGEADRVRAEDRDMCRRIGENALDLFPSGALRVLTHCNAGALATGGIGTALAAVYLAHERGREVRVFAPEARPLLQGSRLTAWELSRAGIPVTLIVDSAAAGLMAAGRVDLAIVGADRVAANGDVANKVGTYALAVLAARHGIPFYVAAPSSTVDLATPTGADIPIEERDPDEVRRGFGRLTAPPGVDVWAPAFDVTPAELVTALVTDRGVARPPYRESLVGLFGEGRPGTGAAAAEGGAA
ncbi:MAG TPA: S-methyl-5-thioribose-1-phosphate isomerase [Longimicrobiales bacterium]|nr:S-methyl-5-thioribose-1-phosphate isomerase [Longimicrobiales bacterium]